MTATDAAQPFKFRFAITTWGTALFRCRIDQDLSYKELSDRVGASKHLIKEVWEKGAGYPSAQQIKRLYASMRKLRVYADLLPRETRDAADTEEAKEAVLLEVPVPGPRWGLSHIPSAPTPAADAPPAPPAPPPGPVQEIDEPRTFHAALRLARQVEGLKQDEVADLVGATQSTVSAWELGEVIPVRECFDKLLSLFPELARAPAPPSRDIPKPTGPLGMKLGSPVSALQRVVARGEPTLPVVSVPSSVLPPIEEILAASPPGPAAGPLSPLEQAGVDYARALRQTEELRTAVEAAERGLAELRARLQAAREGEGATMGRLVAEVSARTGGPG